MGFTPCPCPPEGCGPEGVLVPVRGTAVAVTADGDLLRGRCPETAVFCGLLDDEPVWVVPLTDEPPAGARVVELMALHASVPAERWLLAARAVQLAAWADTHRYCGRCATPTEPAPGELAMRCPACGLLGFPRLAPAVIVRVERDDRILLARNVRFPLPMFSVLAGFVEPGERVEDAVGREVREEVGIEVTDLRWFGSQPWPFPHSLMLAFTCRWAGGELTPDPSEIAEAGWFGRDDLPPVPPPVSIARRLIDDWLHRA